MIGSVSGHERKSAGDNIYRHEPGSDCTYRRLHDIDHPASGTNRSVAGQSPPSPPAVLTNDQTIVFGPAPLPTLPSSVSISSSPLTVYATAETNGAVNGQQVSFSAVSATGTCSIASQSPPDSNGASSATVALNSTGSCTITASQPGTDLSQPGTPPYYNAANSVSGTFTILPQGSDTQSQTITFPQLPNVQYGSTFSLSASSSSTLQVTFTASGPCTASGATTGVGLCKITASALAGTWQNRIAPPR